jgi:uncharacterized membrane protein
MIYETIDWMAKTPLSHLRKLSPYKTLIWAVLCALVIVTAVLGIKIVPSEFLSQLPFGVGSALFSGVRIAWLVLPLSLWTAILLFRPDMQVEKRIVLFFVGTGLVMTLFVELIVLRGDIGRMNTVFKFYLQTWLLFAVSAAAALGWMVESIQVSMNNIGNAKPAWTLFWEVAVFLLVLAAALYPLTAVPAKIDDRMEQSAPHTLDGMKYMEYSHYQDQNTDMDLSQDYAAIRWMQENIKGSPVIIEGNVPEYRWGTRFTIYTGLPGVVGWNWHQRQQRGVASTEWVTERVAEVGSFYQTTDMDQVKLLLNKYQISYIVVGQLEEAYYPGTGLQKFPENEGKLWTEVFHNGDTRIYQVIGK